MEFRSISYKCSVKDLDLEKVKPPRAGIIVYTVYKGDVYFCLGIDHRTKEMTDFGGGVNYKKDIDVIGGALREFREESLDIFGRFSKQDLSNCLCVYNTTSLIIFVRVDVNICQIENFFREIVKLYRRPEVVDIVWLNSSQFHYYIHKDDPCNPCLYNKVRLLLLYAGNFGPYL